MKDQKNQKNPLQNKDKPFKDYIKYSGIAFQMIAVILVGVFVGKLVDSLLNTKVVFTAISTLLFVGLSLYIALKDFIK